MRKMGKLAPVASNDGGDYNQTVAFALSGETSSFEICPSCLKTMKAPKKIK